MYCIENHVGACISQHLSYTALFSNAPARPSPWFFLWQADVTVELTPEDGVDDVTYNVVNTLLEFIESNPPKWQKWKEKANNAGIEWA